MNPIKVRPKWRWKLWLALLLLLGTAIVGKGYWNATRDPVIRFATVSVDQWPKGQKALKILLLSDIHVAGPDMPPKRLVRLVRQFSSLKPDLVLIAGDLVSEKRSATHNYKPKEVVAPLAGLKAPLGVVVAPGNHDHWFDPDALRDELEAVGVTILQNEAVVRGPLVIGGVDDDYSGHDDITKTFAAMKRLGVGPSVVLTHSPDIVPDLPSRVVAVFAGHTHCGQIRLPLFGAVTYISRYGKRFACGAIDDNGQRVFVGAGLGTSILPLRYGTPPDAWVITLGPSRR